MGIFSKDKKTGGFMDVIRCDEPSYLIWKWHPAGSQAGDNKRENEIRWGSSLRVKDGEVAVFVYKQKNGTMAVGGAVGQNIAGSMNSMMSGINQPIQNAMTPPPVPTVMYNVAVNGQATGPYDLATLKQMAIAGQFAGSSLVWKAGMTSWETAETIDELKDVLANVMPPVPQDK